MNISHKFEIALCLSIEISMFLTQDVRSESQKNNKRLTDEYISQYSFFSPRSIWTKDVIQPFTQGIALYRGLWIWNLSY